MTGVAWDEEGHNEILPFPLDIHQPHEEEELGERQISAEFNETVNGALSTEDNDLYLIGDDGDDDDDDDDVDEKDESVAEKSSTEISESAVHG